MTILFKIALIVGALCSLVLVLRKIRKSEIKIADSTFWFVFAVSLVLLALFPQIAFFFSAVLAIESPANFVFLYVVSILVMREFYSTVELSQLRGKLAALAQDEALRNAARSSEIDELGESRQAHGGPKE